MGKSYDIIMDLTSPALPAAQRREALKRFADENNWLPSETITEYPGTEDFCNGHLVIEHGLDNTAVITFLKQNQPFGHLSEEQKYRLLSISYNNLVEWHLFPDLNGLTRVFNRLKSIKDATRYISINEDADVWRAEAFDRIIGRKPNPNIKSLDDALMQTISFWKRSLASELNFAVSNDSISALFNGIFFTRALEDYQRRLKPNTNQILLEKWHSIEQGNTIYFCIEACINDLSGVKPIPKGLFEKAKFNAFDGLCHETVTEIFKDFYSNRFANMYRYDFCLMSKHALSRIYEHYVSLLNRESSPQLTFFPDLPDEINNRTFGGIYTPQYIARFFARYLKENLTPVTFRNIKIVDPACGSGIFLRTILEMQCDPLQEISMQEPTKKAFSNILGIDIDENACQATRLSLSLLHLILTGEFPKLDVRKHDALDYFDPAITDSPLGNYDVAVANPPFIKWENILPAQKDLLKNIMSTLANGKIDMYLAFLKLGLNMLKDGGHLLYVLPHSFLITKNAERLRKEICDSYWIRFVVDLSEIDVFEGVGAYVILLILQKKIPAYGNDPRTVIVRCRDCPGLALQTALEGKKTSNDLFDIYEIDQSAFIDNEWRILPQKFFNLKAKLEKFPKLEEFVTIRVGFNTGANDIFIRQIAEIPDNEKSIYIPYLQDREMSKYKVPSRTQEMVLYPYIGNSKITEETFKTKYPRTWKYLEQHRTSLRKRKAVTADTCRWWSPERARRPENMLRPKIITPHLVLVPKFSIDIKGKYAVSRSPLMYLKSPEGDVDLLYYFLAVLNSPVAYWQIAHFSHKYSHGYFMLEPKTLNKLNVPDPSSVPPGVMQKIQSLVKDYLKMPTSETERSINGLVVELYGLSHNDQAEIGMEY